MDDELRWDDPIDTDEKFSFALLEEGDYTFTVVDVKREISSKGNNMIKVTLNINSENGTVRLLDYFTLKKSVKWKISSFLRSVDLKKHGIDVPLSTVLKAVGKSGRCHISQKKFTPEKGENKGKETIQNSIDDYYDYVKPAQTTPAEQASQADVPW